jgi:hypothetical protein
MGQDHRLLVSLLIFSLRHSGAGRNDEVRS